MSIWTIPINFHSVNWSEWGIQDILQLFNLLLNNAICKYALERITNKLHPLFRNCLTTHNPFFCVFNQLILLKWFRSKHRPSGIQIIHVIMHFFFSWMNKMIFSSDSSSTTWTLKFKSIYMKFKFEFSSASNKQKFHRLVSDEWASVKSATLNGFGFTYHSHRPWKLLKISTVINYSAYFQNEELNVILQVFYSLKVASLKGYNIEFLKIYFICRLTGKTA